MEDEAHFAGNGQDVQRTDRPASSTMGIKTRMRAQVEAEGNTDSRPLPGFTPRKGKGLPIFGKSSSTPPKAKV